MQNTGVHHGSKDTGFPVPGFRTLIPATVSDGKRGHPQWVPRLLVMFCGRFWLWDPGPCSRTLGSLFLFVIQGNTYKKIWKVERKRLVQKDNFSRMLLGFPVCDWSLRMMAVCRAAVTAVLHASA